MPTGAGWTASWLLFVGLFRDAIAGPSALGHTGLIVACTGSLAWGLRLLLNPLPEETLPHESSRAVLVGIRAIIHHREVEVAPKTVARRMTPFPASARTEPAHVLERSKEQKAGSDRSAKCGV